MRAQTVVITLAAVLVMTPAASAELRTGTAKDPVGDAKVAGIGFAQAKDIVQVDARYDRTAGDIVVDATMAGDVPSMGRHYYQSFLIELRSRGAAGCDGEQRVTIFALGSNDWGFWDRVPVAVAPGTRTSITNGDTQVKRSGRHVAVRAGFGPVQGAGLRDLDLTCVTVDVRGPSDDRIALGLGLTIPGPLYDRLDTPIVLHQAKKGTPKVSLKSSRTRDRSKPLTYRASGSVVLPASITKNATWCSGRVFISLKRGPVTVGATTVKLKPDCTYARTVSITGNARLAKRNGRTKGTLKLGARFAGNTLLNAKSATSKTVRYGPR